jgi:L,D-transpeptidase catalytic domain
MRGSRNHISNAKIIPLIEGMPKMRKLFAAGIALFLMAGHALANVLAVIDKGAQTMTVSQDGERLWVWRVSTGRPGFVTPSGTFHPTFLDPDHASSKYESAPMPWSVFFNGDIALHGTMEVRHLGSAVSHGCVRLHPANAEKFFQLVQDAGLDAVTIRVTTSKSRVTATRDPGFYRPKKRVRPNPWIEARPRYEFFDWGWDF